MTEILDHYAEENFDGTYVKLDGVHPAIGTNYSAAEQCTLLSESPELEEEGQYYTLDSVKFYLMRVDPENLLTGNLVVKIYDSPTCAANGGCPSGDVLATSSSVDITTLDRSGHSLVEFAFTGDNRITLDGTSYAISLEVASGSGFTAQYYISVGADGSSPAHIGSFCQYYGGNWQTDDTKDLIFYIYGVSPENGNGDDDGNGDDETSRRKRSRVSRRTISGETNRNLDEGERRVNNWVEGQRNRFK